MKQVEFAQRYIRYYKILDQEIKGYVEETIVSIPHGLKFK